MHEQKILIIDYGSQYTQLIARRIRENKTYCEVIQPESINKKNNFDRVIGIILSGGPNSVTANNNYDLPDTLFKNNVPILGICFGMQLLCKKFNGKIQDSISREYGKALLKIKKDEKIFNDLDEELEVWMSHGDSVTEAPVNFSIIASTNKKNISAIKSNDKEVSNEIEIKSANKIKNGSNT